MKKHPSRLILATALGFVVFLSINGCGRQSNDGKTIARVTIGYPVLRIAVPVFVAKERGFFEKQGLNVELKRYDTAQPMMDALVSGNLDVGGYCALPITFGAMGRSKSQLVFLTAMMEDDQHPISMLIVKKDSGIKSIKDLAGKRIGILPTRAYEVWLQTVLTANGVDPTTVIIQQIAPPLQADALGSGSVQALFTNDPASTAAIVKGHGVLITNTALVPAATGMNPFYFGSFNVTKKFADENKETVKKLSLALDEAIAFIRSNPQETREAMKKYLPAEQGGLVDRFPESMFWTTKQVTNADLIRMRDYYKAQNVLSADIDISNAQYAGP